MQGSRYPSLRLMNLFKMKHVFCAFQHNLSFE